MDIESRTLQEAKYICDNKTTIRETAKHFGVSKSTAHLDLSKRLPAIDSYLFYQVKDILEFNFAVRHIRGGESTKKKFKAMEVEINDT